LQELFSCSKQQDRTTTLHIVECVMHEMNSGSKIEIIDITENSEYERYLYKCLAPMPFRKYRKRREYLEAAIPKGFHKNF